LLRAAPSFLTPPEPPPLPTDVGLPQVEATPAIERKIARREPQPKRAERRSRHEPSKLNPHHRIRQKALPEPIAAPPKPPPIPEPPSEPTPSYVPEPEVVPAPVPEPAPVAPPPNDGSMEFAPR